MQKTLDTTEHSATATEPRRPLFLSFSVRSPNKRTIAINVLRTRSIFIYLFNYSLMWDIKQKYSLFFFKKYLSIREYLRNKLKINKLEIN